jgi:hypothetical protein
MVRVAPVAGAKRDLDAARVPRRRSPEATARRPAVQAAYLVFAALVWREALHVEGDA